MLSPHEAAGSDRLSRNKCFIVHRNSYRNLLFVKTDPSTDLEFIVLIARHGNLSGAARALDLTPPAATKRLALIESRLGVRLVNRTTRKISLTSEGETYLMYATRILQDVREMEEAVTSGRGTPRGLIRLNATLGFGRTTIAPIVSEFARKYPEVEVQVEVTDSPVDLVESGFDLAIRFGALPDTRLNARRLMTNRRFLCASPKYLKRHGVPGSLVELAGHRCIGRMTMPTGSGASCTASTARWSRSTARCRAMTAISSSAGRSMATAF
jgi:LysR family transcriptional regulator, transcriptional activator for dmlA